MNCNQTNSARYVPPGRRARGRGLAVRRKPTFSVHENEFPDLAGNSVRRDPGGADAAEVGEYLGAVAEDQAELDLMREQELEEEDELQWCWLPQSSDAELESSPPTPAHYARAARLILAQIQAKREQENRALEEHSQWWGVPSVMCPLTSEEEPDLRPWGWEEGDDLDIEEEYTSDT